jgi:hypothetical protein
MPSGSVITNTFDELKIQPEGQSFNQGWRFVFKGYV